MAKGLLAVALCVGNKERGSIDPLVHVAFYRRQPGNCDDVDRHSDSSVTKMLCCLYNSRLTTATRESSENVPISYFLQEF